MKDFEIRNVLTSRYLSHYQNNPNARVVNELKVCNGNARIDLAVINGYLIGYEIKSSSDNLFRLSSQIEHYNKVFDYITIVAEKSHLDGILNVTPNWWGVWIIENKGDIISKNIIRRSLYNKDTDAFSIAQLLWQEELIDLILKNGLDYKMINKRRWIQWEYVASSLSIIELKRAVRHYLRLRTDWKNSKVHAK